MINISRLFQWNSNECTILFGTQIITSGIMNMFFAVILPILAFLLVPALATLDVAFKTSLENFSKNIFNELMQTNGRDNVIYSPFSLETCLAMTRMGAEGKTALEMDNVMGFANTTVEAIAHNFNSVLTNYENSETLKMANKIYVMNGFELFDNYTNVLRTQFFASAESVNFGKRHEAAGIINAWVDDTTNHLIKNIVSPSMCNNDTRLFLLSAIQFKGRWQYPFDKSLTRRRNFYNDETTSVEVDMMKTMFPDIEYKRVHELNAMALKMPYNNSDLSMLILLPKSRTGLTQMLEKLHDYNLYDLICNMYKDDLVVTMPKFKVEFEIDMTHTLQKLGMVHLFDNAELGKMLKSSRKLSVSTVVHKASIEVNEEGTEASAATGMELSFRMLPGSFKVDHPFYYAIINTANVILFQGTIVTL